MPERKLFFAFPNVSHEMAWSARGVYGCNLISGQVISQDTGNFSWPLILPSNFRFNLLYKLFVASWKVINHCFSKETIIILAWIVCFGKKDISLHIHKNHIIHHPAWNIQVYSSSAAKKTEKLSQSPVTTHVAVKICVNESTNSKIFLFYLPDNFGFHWNLSLFLFLPENFGFHLD